MKSALTAGFLHFLLLSFVPVCVVRSISTGGVMFTMHV